jgi:hypothetical protein
MAYAETTALPSAAAAADWPRTTRVLPWLAAALVAMLFLVPIDSTLLGVPLPFDPRPDRLLLLVAFLVWALAAAVGAVRRSQGGHRYGAVDLFLAAFALAAIASVAANVGPLSRAGELDIATKKLVLLASYVAFYVFLVEVLRPTEVPALIRFVVALAVVVAVGTLVESLSEFNPFFWAAEVFGPPGTRVSPDSLLLTPGGRRDVTGPARHGLADSALLAMMLPLAVGGSVFAKLRKDRLLFGIAAALIFVGAVATLRRSGVILPFVGAAVVLVFSGRRMLPTAAVFGVMVLATPIVAPGVVREVSNEFARENVNAQQSIAGRTSDYGAVVADVRYGALLGRGFGSFEARRYRILDNQYLGAIVETGGIGLIAYTGLILAAAGSALVAARRRRSPDAWIALAGAGSALVFLCANAFFDALAFPHAPYAFLLVAALVAVWRRGTREQPAEV